jgi:hypothetical protein
MILPSLPWHNLHPCENGRHALIFFSVHDLPKTISESNDQSPDMDMPPKHSSAAAQAQHALHKEFMTGEQKNFDHEAAIMPKKGSPSGSYIYIYFPYIKRKKNLSPVAA